MLFLKIIRKFVNNVNSSPNEYKYAQFDFNNDVTLTHLEYRIRNCQ